MLLVKYKYSESSVEPSEVEINKNTVYIRKNIVFDEISYLWRYQEAIMTLDEFSEYSKTLNAKNANDISQLVSKQKTVDDNQLVIMEAIADLYDAIASLKQEGLS